MALARNEVVELCEDRRPAAVWPLHVLMHENGKKVSNPPAREVLGRGRLGRAF